MPILAEVARDVVTQFPELKLSRTLWASGEQRPKTKANLGCWKCTTRASRGFNGFSQPGNWMPSIHTPHTHSLYKSLLVRLLQSRNSPTTSEGSLPARYSLHLQVHRSSPHCCCCLVAKSCLTLCDPMDRSPSYSSVHGVSQARILEWVAISFSRGSCQPRDQTLVSCIGRWGLYSPHCT